MVPTDVGIRVEGGRKLRKALTDIGEDLQDLKELHGAIARVVAGATSAPRGPTGNLAASVRAGAGSKARAIVRAGTGETGKVPYANPIHWGWPRRHIRPNTFLTDAASQTEPRWYAMYVEGVTDIVERHAAECDGKGG